MDISIVPEIKRKRKIGYNKVKGRLNRFKVSNLLNKSVCKENIRKQHNESKFNRSQLVSAKSVNAFLEKNKELANALQDTKCQVKELEKEKFTFQLDNIKMRAKLNITTNAILKCECKKSGASTQTLDLLNKVKFTLSQSSNLLAEYMDSLVMEKVGEVVNNNDHTTGIACKMIDKEVQTEAIKGTDVDTQTEKVLTKNKKVQVSHHGNGNWHHCCKDEQDSKTTQTESIPTKSKMIQCSISENNYSVVNKALDVKLPKSGKRTPLQPINSNQQKSRPSNLRINEEKHSVLKPKNTIKSPFKIYEDNDEFKPDKSEKKKSIQKVTTQSPVQVFKYGERKCLRSRKNRPNYAENVDVKFYNSPKMRKKIKRKGKKSVKNLVPLELVFSMIEETLKASSNS